jgi:hypothetical protein
MPQYVGAVRVMVVAGRDSAFGVAESVPVRQDDDHHPAARRAAGQQFDLPVAVFVSRADIRRCRCRSDPETNCASMALYRQSR